MLDQDNELMGAPEIDAEIYKDKKGSEHWFNRSLSFNAIDELDRLLFKFRIKHIELPLEIKSLKVFMSGGNKAGDELIDKTRASIVGTAKQLIKYPCFSRNGEKGKAEIQRWLFSTYVEGLISSAKNNSQVDASLRGTAWSLLAKDVPIILQERGQIIDKDWLFRTMGPLLRSGQDKDSIRLELNRFVAGDPDIIHVQ